MEETFLGPAIEKLLSLLVEEVKSLRGVRGEINSLKDELEIIQPLLKDAEAKLEKGDMNDVVKAWIKQIREEATRIEDVIDEYFYHVEQYRGQYRRGFIMGFLCKACHFIKALKPRHEIASEIKIIKQSLSEIKGRAQGYGLKPLEEGSSRKTTDVEADDPRLRSLFMENDELVGIESTSKELIGRLVEGPSTRLVISLVGEGGVGKTTLVKKVYDDDAVNRHFESARAWITVSQSYNLKKLLKDMKRQICKTREDKNVGEMDSVRELIDFLKEYLRTKRYVIVFDDVWQENFWENIKFALPKNEEGSRIMITTRNATVAKFCKETPHDIIQNLEPWSPVMALELFCKTAFRYDFQGKCPKELEKLSIEIVSKCQGLPLAIVAIASLLATKEKVDFEWQKVLNDLHFKVEMNSQFITRIHKVLSLGYYDLTYPLRSCLLYFGVFPEAYSILDERLYRLWIAEGFVKARRGKTIEEVAQEYLNELIQRNLVTRDTWQPYGTGEGKRFRVHDLMHDVILSRTDEVFFSQRWDDQRDSKFKGKGRRLTIHGSIKDVLKNAANSGVRSILFFNSYDRELTESSIASLFKKFKLLEVLDFENTLVDTLPRQLGYLFHLKYLSLNSTKITLLPKCISKLYNLQSLDIRHTLIRELPKEINKLINLRHLLAYSYNNPWEGGVMIEKGFGDMVDLQTLTLVKARDVGVVKELEKLRKLRWLGVSKLTRETGKILCTSVGKMDHLERLYISSTDEDELLDLQLDSSSSPPHFLRELILIGRLEKLPGWILTLKNLCLEFSKLIEEPSKCLKDLPNLETLQLGVQAYEGEQVQFEEGSFQKLRRLVLAGLGKLKVVKIERGALPLLEVLRIQDCFLLQEDPSIQQLRNLKTAMINGRRLL